MHRFYLPPSQCQDSILTLTGTEANHAAKVVRIRKDERVAVLDGAGNEFLCEVRSVDARTVALGLVHKNAAAPFPYEITLLQGVTKGKSMDLIIQKGTELGVGRIVPILSERSVPQVGEGKAAAKADKWRAIAIEALKQSGSPWLPRIEPAISPGEFMARGEKTELPLVASLQPGARHPREHFRSFAAEHQRAPNSVSVWIGPEGDYTPAEMNAIRSSGALPMTLGRLILRSETAAIYSLSMLNYELTSPGG